jgi:hypothetical protein
LAVLIVIILIDIVVMVLVMRMVLTEPPRKHPSPHPLALEMAQHPEPVRAAARPEKPADKGDQPSEQTEDAPEAEQE